MSRGQTAPAVRTVLIFRLGSLGDTVVALPSFRHVARAFPGARRVVLTNVPRSARETDLDVVLGGTGLVDAYMHFDPADRSAAAIARVRREIRALAPDVLVYLAESSTRMRMLRHLAFFVSCGIPSIVGMPEFGAGGQHLFDPATRLWESEAAFLLRRLRLLGPASADDPALWDLGFAPDERAAAAAALRDFAAVGDFVAVAPGAKIEAKDWGEENWLALARGLAARHPGLGLVVVGGPADRGRAAALCAAWNGPARDLCGAVVPRVSALVLARARLLATHDSGPMHLAAAVGTPCMAVFSARAKPGIWFPRGNANRVLHREVSCGDCGLEVCIAERKRCIAAIGADEALAACEAILAAHPPGGARA
jgi:ADP-heptose:LPS heptosyltransferase